MSQATELNYLSRFGQTNDLAQCLLPLLDALGWRGSHDDLIEALPHFTSELDQADLLNTMANLKFESKTLETRLSGVDERMMPCLFLPDNGPAKVLIKKIEKEAFLFDGGTQGFTTTKMGRLKGTAVFFDMMSSETVGLLKPQKDWFQKVLLRFRKIFILGFLITFILSLFSLATPLFVMSIYDQVLAADSLTTLFQFIIGVVVFILGDFGFHLLRSHLQNFVSLRLSYIVGNEVLRRILYLPPALTETASIGSQVARIKDFESVREFFAGHAAVALMELPFITLLLLVMTILAGPTVYVPITGLVFFVVFGLVISPTIKDLNQRYAQSASRKQEFVVETLSNLRAVKYTGSYQDWIKRYRQLDSHASWDSFKLQQVNSLVIAVSHGLVSLSVLGTIAVSVHRVMAGTMTVGALMACMLLVWRILAPMKAGFSVLTQLGRIQKSILQLNKLMSFKLENKLESAMSYNQRIQGRVSFRQVSVRYNPEAHPALLGTSFSIEPGELLVVVGHDGSGKSTLFKLLLGLYNAQAGQVLIDGMNVRQMDPITLRRSIGYAPQKAQLFHGTLAQNLQMARPTATEEDLEQAAIKAGLIEEINQLPERFGTRIKRSNIGQFTDGFVQRVGLAQVFLKQSPLMLLDKPELGINIAAEREFFGHLEALKGETTQIIITERAPYMELADKILWLEKGRVRQFGPAEDVLMSYYQHISA